jgi:hypothetical protein
VFLLPRFTCESPVGADSVQRAIQLFSRMRSIAAWIAPFASVVHLSSTDFAPIESALGAGGGTGRICSVQRLALEQSNSMNCRCEYLQRSVTDQNRPEH